MQGINNKFIKKRDWDRKAAFNDMSAERFLDDYGYGDETGKISANKFRTNGYNDKKD